MKFFKVAVLSASVALTAACQTTQETAPAAPVKAEAAQTENLRNTQLFEVHKDNRIYVFYDYALYEDFLSMVTLPTCIRALVLVQKAKLLFSVLLNKIRKSVKVSLALI